MLITILSFYISHRTMKESVFPFGRWKKSRHGVRTDPRSWRKSMMQMGCPQVFGYKSCCFISWVRTLCSSIGLEFFWETEPVGYMWICRRRFSKWALVHVTMEYEIGHNTPSESWRTKKSSGIIQFKSNGLRKVRDKGREEGATGVTPRVQRQEIRWCSTFHSI